VPLTMFLAGDVMRRAASSGDEQRHDGQAAGEG